LGFTNWPVIYYKPTSFLAPSSPRHQQVFWRRCREYSYINYIFPRQLSPIKFSGAVAGEEVEDFCEGSFRTHILYIVIVLLYFIYFTCIILYQKTQKN
jgi:hypothetical protein